MVTKQELEKIAQEFDTSNDFDSVMAYYDVMEISKQLEGRTILEMGSNAGTVTKYLLPLVKKLDIVEGSLTGIKRTKKLLGHQEKINYFYNCWENFEPTKVYSDIVLIRGLEHVEEPSMLLTQMKEWVQKDGKIHIIVPNARSLHRQIMVAQGELSTLYSLRDRDYQIGHMRVYDSESLENDVKKSGLRIKSLKGFFIKEVSTAKMAEISMNPLHPLVQACYAAGKLTPSLGTQLYLVAKK